MSDSTIESQQIVSRLIDYLDKYNSKIFWNRACYNGRRYLNEKDLINKLDSDFPQSKYEAKLLDEEISLDYIIDWNKKSSHFAMRFTKRAKIGLDPPPKDIVLFYNDPFLEKTDSIPIFQARYRWINSDDFKEAKIAMNDFVDNGKKLANYFQNMRDESVKEYLKLVEKFKKFREVEEIIRLC